MAFLLLLLPRASGRRATIAPLQGGGGTFFSVKRGGYQSKKLQGKSGRRIGSVGRSFAGCLVVSVLD